MLNTVNNINDCPSAIRFPRGEANQEINIDDQEILTIGKGRIIQKGETVAIIAYGTILQNVIQASKILQHEHNLKITIADARFAKPFDQELILELVKNHQLLMN
jgi:1-deoxy-D-xylulose-5-phosphate synthase